MNKQTTDAAAKQPQHSRNSGSGKKWPRFAGPAWMTERWFAWRMSRELLAIYRSIRSEEPKLAGRPLYERVLIRRSGLNSRGAAGVLRRAEQSFCEWPSERELRFRELVQYIVIDEYLRSHADQPGTHTSMERVVTRMIPRDL